jgi:hypothetical protein
LVAAIAEVFEFRPDWHRQHQAVRLVRQYELKLTSILEAHPDLHDCVAGCCHCGIRFLTFRCNRGRRDLGCPFGCRDHHRRQLANVRSRKHYRTQEGKKRKEERNSLRCPIDLQEQPAPQASASPQASPAGEASLLLEELPCVSSVEPASTPLSLLLHSHAADVPSEQLKQRAHDCVLPDELGLTDDVSPVETWSLELEGVVLTQHTLASSPVLSYLCGVIRVLERRTITRQELLQTLGESLRQRSLGARSRREYVLSYLNEHPPPEASVRSPHEPIGRTSQS